MTAPTLPPPVAAPGGPARQPPRLRGSSALGLLVVLLGAGWLAESTGLVALRWRTVLSVAVVAVGVVLIATVRASRGEGLVVLGVLLAGLLVMSTTLPSLPASAGVGEREYGPSSLAELRQAYELGTGDLALDLRALRLPDGRTPVAVRLGMGQVTVRVPGGVTVEVDARSGAGSLEVLGARREGLAPSLEDERYGAGSAVLALDVSVGLGSVLVTR